MAGKFSSPVTLAEFAALIEPFLSAIFNPSSNNKTLSSLRLRGDDNKECGDDKIAVAVSGGADSLALLLLLSDYAAHHGRPQILALTVDHGLRPESAAEAKQVKNWVKNWPYVTHQTLRWRGDKPQTKIAEKARAARYDLLVAACKKKGIRHLFVAHHLDDQAETVLLRLAAGSGVDGLAGMAGQQERDGILLLRPLLSVSHADLCATLRARGQDWIEDPTNQNPAYARPRLRAATDVLAAEGLTPARLSVLAARARRMRDFAEGAADAAMAAHVQAEETGVRISRRVWENIPHEIQVRVMAHLVGPRARLEQIEDLVGLLRTGKNTRRTLAGKIVSLGAKWVRVTGERGR